MAIPDKIRLVIDLPMIKKNIVNHTNRQIFTGNKKDCAI